MAASLGAVTYTPVTWTAGDVITEAKLDNMVANDQAYDSHAAQGLLLNNTKSFAGRNAADDANFNVAKINASDEMEIGEEGLHQKVWSKFTDIVTAADGATVTFDLSKGNVQKVTLGGNRTLALSNPKIGQVFFLIIIQDGTGSRIPVWFSTIKWSGGDPPTLSTGANDIDVFAFICYSSGNYYGSIVGQDFS